MQKEIILKHKIKHTNEFEFYNKYVYKTLNV